MNLPNSKFNGLMLEAAEIAGHNLLRLKLFVRKLAASHPPRSVADISG